MTVEIFTQKTTGIANADALALSHRLPALYSTLATVLYALIISFAIVGNGCVLVVYLLTTRRRTYFRIVLINLALADIILGCIVPFTMYQVCSLIRNSINYS